MLSVLLIQNCHAALFFTDHFNYSDGVNLGSTIGGGGAAWSAASGDVTQIRVTASSAQSSPASYAPASGLGVAVTPTGTRKQTGLAFNGTTGVPVGDGNVVYASFLLNVQTLPTLAQGNQRVAYLHSVAATSGGIELVVNRTGQAGIQKKGSGTTYVAGTPFASPGRHLVIMRYKFQTGNDEVALWVDPSNTNYGLEPAPTNGLFAATTGGGSDMTSAIQYFFIESAALTGPLFWLDEVRVATTWSEAVPASGSVSPSAVPVITQELLLPQGMVLRGSNGPPGSNYQVLATTNASLPMTNWPTIASQVFDSTGRFDSTNPITPGLDRQFFRLLVGGTNLTAPTAPNITSQPQSLTVAAGATSNFTVVATGTAPLSYFWSFNTNTPVGINSNSLTLANIQAGDAGDYRVIVSNSAGTATSSVATLTVLAPPVITLQPQSQTITVSNDATFTVASIGTAPISYQWFFNTNTPLGINSNVLALPNVQTSNAGKYSVIITNSYGAVTSAFATLTVSTSIVNNVQFNLVGFGQAATGGGQLADTSTAYAKVTNAVQLANAVLAFNKTGGVRVIEIMNDLDLGWNEIGTAVQNLVSTPFTAHTTPKLHPRLLTTGVSKMDIKYSGGGLTIFSANGATIRHCTFNIKSTHNIIVRNLKFDEMWEWDESSSPPGGYDKNDWDYIDLANGGSVYDIWIDHCTFTKAYDGIVDIKAGSTNVTLSWCSYTGDDGAVNSNSFVWQQINSMESNRPAQAFYNFLRNNGYSTTNIVQIIQGHDKTHLMGSNDKDPNNVNLSATFHHLWMRNCWDRAVPRLRAGNVHDFNIYVDDTDALAAKRLRDAVQSTMSVANSNALDTSYSFNPPLNGSISTEGGAILVEKSAYIDCLYPLRNNQTAPLDSTYTGKIMALDTIYHMDNADTTTTDFRGDSTNAPGSNYFGPAQAVIIPFSWNGFTTLPYVYTNVVTDPAQLQTILSNYAGAGKLTWSKTNWLKTAY